MSKKKKDKKISTKGLIFSIMITALIVFAFVIGTFVGFQRGVDAGINLRVLTGCTIVDCAELGVDALVCEVCIEEDQFVTKMLAG